MNKPGFIFADKLNDNCHLRPLKIILLKKKEIHPSIAAVQISAAITAYARIYMYPIISRDDCIYTDTYSAVTQHPLPPELLSDTELGKFKLEDKIV